MSSNPNPAAKPEDAPVDIQLSPSAQSATAAEAEKKKALAEAVNNILKGIPFIGPYIVIIKLKWGWTGILLLFAGFLIAAILIGTGLYPERGISHRYGGTSNYKLLPAEKVNWQEALSNAKTRICASGVALSKIDPKLVSDKVKAGVSVQLIYVNPCGAAVQERQADENNPHASANVTSAIQKLGDFTKDLSTAQKQGLHVMLSPAYPTMIVMIIDNDLYAYFCPYGAECSTSPVMVFSNYREKSPETAMFFEKNFFALSNVAKQVSDLHKTCNAPVTSPSPAARPPD